MGKRLEKFGEVRIVDKNGFKLNFVEKTESRFWSTTPDVGASLQRRTDLGLAYRCAGLRALAAVLDFLVQLKDVYFAKETAWSLSHHGNLQYHSKDYSSRAYRRFFERLPEKV